MIEVFSPKDMIHTMPKGSRKKTINQKLPGIARIQKTAGFFRQLSKVSASVRGVPSPRKGKGQGGDRPPLIPTSILPFSRGGRKSSSCSDARPSLIAQPRSFLADIDAGLALGDY